MIIPLWEWTVTRNGAGGASGVSMTCADARGALSKALIDAGAVAAGCIVPMALADGVHGPFYVRDPPQHTARCEGGVIRWR
jgi:hypothetical protein